MNAVDTYIQSLLHFVGQHPALAVLVVFIAAFSEAVPVIGAVVPGSAIVVGVSALIGLGHLAFWPILIGAVLGGIIGDGLSYWFGHHYKAQALSMWPLSRHPAMISTSENFFLRHGGKSIAIARFTPVIRAFVPLIAGISGMSPIRFYIFNVVSALAWAPIHVLPGAAIGASLGILGVMSGRVLSLVAIVVVTIILLMWLIKLFWQKLMVLLANGQQWLFSCLAHKDGRLVSILRNAVDPERSAVRNVAILVAVLAAVVLMFSNLVAEVVAQGEMGRADNAVANLVTQLRTVWSDRVLVFVTTLADTPITAAVALVTAIWLWCIGQRPLAFGLIALVTVTTLFALGLKATAHIPRPSAMYAGAVEFSFPSGHATFVTAIYGVLGWITARDLARPWRTIVIGIVVSLIVIVAISRVYLGAHWPSDVMAGLLFGIGATVVFALAFRSASLTSRERLSMAGVAMLTLVAVGGWHLSSSYATALQRYAPVDHVTQLTAAQWRASEWMKVPAWRVDLGGEEEEPLVLQWVGSTADLAAALSAGGWRAGKELRLSTFPTFLAGTTVPSELPVIPQLNAGYAPDLTLIRIKSGNERDVMRIWDSRIRVENGSPKALFVGSVVRERLDHPLGWTTVSRMVDPADIDIPDLLGSLPNAVVVKRSDPVLKSERGGERRTNVLASQ